MQELIEYMNKLESESFEGWSEEAKRGYLTAIISIREKAKTIIFIQ